MRVIVGMNKRFVEINNQRFEISKEIARNLLALGSEVSFE